MIFSFISEKQAVTAISASAAELSLKSTSIRWDIQQIPQLMLFICVALGTFLQTQRIHPFTSKSSSRRAQSAGK
jgi:hypothetical protein